VSDNPTISIIVEGTDLTDSFEEFSVYMSMETISGGISITTTDFNPDIVRNWDIKIGDQYEFKINNETVSKGYIDEFEINEDEEQYNITFSGRDKTADLIDCHYVKEDQEGSWEDLTNLGIIKRLCEPFNVTVKYDKSVSKVLLDKPERKFTSDQATNVIDLIMKACTKIGVLPMSIGDGNLTLTKSTSTKIFTDLLDKNMVKSRNILYSDRDRFSNYFTKGQSEGTDSLRRLGLLSGVGNEKQIKDDYFGNRYRPYMLLLDDSVKDKDCEQKAIFEKNSRAANSRQIEFVLQGVTSAETGRVWRPNYLVNISDPMLPTQELLLISEVQLSGNSEGGFETTLKLIDKKAYSLEENAKVKTEIDS